MQTGERGGSLALAGAALAGDPGRVGKRHARP